MLKPIRLVMIVLMLVVALGTGLLFWARKTGRFVSLSSEKMGIAPEVYRVGAPFELLSHRNEPISHKVMEGRSVVVFFGFTSCPEICPTTLLDVDRWMTAADPSGEKLSGYFITVDPERDDPEIMGSYVTYFSDRITGITGEPEAVWALADAWNVYYEKRPYSDDPDDGYDMNHTASVFLVDANGKFRGTISWGEPDRVAIEKLRNLL